MQNTIKPNGWVKEQVGLFKKKGRKEIEIILVTMEIHSRQVTTMRSNHCSMRGERQIGAYLKVLSDSSYPWKEFNISKGMLHHEEGVKAVTV